MTVRPTAPSKADDSRLDLSLPSDDNESSMDLALAGDAISDKLEFAVHRTGLTPRLKVLMAALRHMRDVGEVKFKAPVNLMRFLAMDGLKVFPSSDMEPAWAPPTPTPPFARPRPRR